MMLHEKTIKNAIIKNLQGKIQEFEKITHCKEAIFNTKIKTYIGVKLHHGYIFLINEGNSIVYPRGIHGSVLREVYKIVKNKDIHGILLNGDQKIKIKMKKN
jgi:hypothetical protein